MPDYKFKAGDELEFLIQNTQIPSNKWLVENCKSKLNFTSFEDVTNYLLEKEEKLIQMQFALSPMGKKFINHNGTILPISDINESNRSNQFSFNSLGLMHTKKIVMLFDGIDAGTDIVSASYSVTFENGSMHQNSIFTYAFVNNKLSVTIFNREGHYFTNILDGDVQFQGTLITSSNEQIIFNGYGTIRDEQSGGGSSSQNLDWGSEFYGNGGDSNVNFNLTGNGSYTIPDATTVTNPQTGEIIVVPIAGSESSLDNHELENPIDGAILSAIEYIPSGFGVKRLGIADYRRVEQEICCYVPGEVSHIENVMASEYKERSTRRLRRTEDTTTTLKEKESEKLTDSTSTERFEMNQEVATVLTEDTHLGGFVSADTKFGKASELHAGADFANNTSSDESNTQAVMHAKDITERVLDRVVQKIKEERISKVIEEFEENNKHGYDNRENSEHVSGVYRWVDKIYKNKIINYGKRLMYEFMIPEPAVFHKKAIEGRKIDEGEIIVKPVDPRIGSDNLKLSIDTINKSYKYWAEIYNVDVEVCPEETIRVGESFRVAYDSTGVKIGATEAQSGFGKIKIPANYVANYAIGNYNAISENAYGRISLTIGDITKSTVAGTNFKTLNINEPLKGNYSLEVPVSFTLISMLIGDITANVICKLTDSAKQQWQVETFNAIIKAYENKLEEYNAKIKEAKAIQTEKLKTNPLFYRQIENTVLRKNCIEYLASHEQVGKSFIKNGALKDMQVHFDSPNLETYVAKIKFLEQAFEWNLMSYNLYPFYWANKDNWETLYNIEETDDATFRAFLQSGMARVILTIRPGFEEVVNWYMATGQVWNGGQVPTMDDELFISIVEELTETEGEIEETWESRVPTSLTIIQAGSIGLEVESALPCDDECKDYKLFDTDGNPVFDKENKQVSTNPFKKKTTNLKGKSAEPLNVKIDDRKIENIDLKNGNLQLTTNSKPRKVIAQISVEAIKREMGLNQGK